MGKHGKRQLVQQDRKPPSADTAPRVPPDPCGRQRHTQALAERLLAFGTWMWEPTNGYMEWSDGLYGLLGYAPGTVTPNYQAFVTAFHPQDRPGLLVQLEACLDSGAAVSFSGRGGGAGYASRVRVMAEASHPSGRRLRHVQGIVQAVARDIAEQEQVTEVIRQANRRLAATLGELRARQRQDVQTEKLTALGTLAAGIAHELNNPMMGVMNYVDYARRNLAAPETVQDVLTRAARELERIRDLLKNMLAFARPIDEPSGEFSLHSVIGAALDLMTHEFRARQIEVKLDLPFGLPAVWAKEGHLQQVFVNLLMNARDALANAPRKEVSIRAVQEGTRVRVDVTDSGAGIPVAIRHRIFDPFFTTKPPGKGTGLGLSISRAIMLEQGGDLVYRDRPGGGTTLSVSIPAISSKEGESP